MPSPPLSPHACEKQIPGALLASVGSQSVPVLFRSHPLGWPPAHALSYTQPGPLNLLVATFGHWNLHESISN